MRAKRKARGIWPAEHRRETTILLLISRFSHVGRKVLWFQGHGHHFWLSAENSINWNWYFGMGPNFKNFLWGMLSRESVFQGKSSQRMWASQHQGWREVVKKWKEHKRTGCTSAWHKCWCKNSIKNSNTFHPQFPKWCHVALLILVFSLFLSNFLNHLRISCMCATVLPLGT